MLFSRSNFIPFLLFVINFAVSFIVLANQNSPELILFNGKIFTSDSINPTAEAIAVGGVGSDEEIKKLANAKTRLIDVQMRVVTPGFNDAHNHFMPKPPGFNLQLTDLERGWAETVEAIKNAVKETPKGQWINVALSSLDKRFTGFVPTETRR